MNPKNHELNEAIEDIANILKDPVNSLNFLYFLQDIPKTDANYEKVMDTVKKFHKLALIANPKYKSIKK